MTILWNTEFTLLWGVQILEFTAAILLLLAADICFPSRAKVENHVIVLM